MRRTLLCFQVICLAAVVIAIALAPAISSAATCEKWAGKVVSLQGTVDAKVAGGTQWQPAKLNDTYCPGDMLRTGRRSRAEVALQNHPLLRLDENSTITFAGMKDERTSLIDMLSGAALFFSRVTRNLEVRTATVNAGVEGTEFFIKVEEDKTSLSVFEGKVLASNEAGSLPVTTGQSAVAEKGKAPVPLLVIRPRDAVRWAIYYPPVIYVRPDDFQSVSDPGLKEMLQKSVDSYWKGDLAGAFSAIEGAPQDISDPTFFTYRASLLLTVGRVDEARADIDQALRLDPKNSDAFALQSIVAVAQNDQEKALNLAQKAVEAGPKSPTAKIALSYAQQAGFNLEGALNSVNEAVTLGPENALAWARLADLRQSFGELEASLTAANKAATLSPGLSRTQTVLGFAYLTEVNTREAINTFSRAIELDQSDPLPRLGLGLAKIREGHLEEGRRELEIAATLDPDNGLIRSYLGKAYYEEKRDKLATGQYGMAKTLDPIDPTPYFYDAILKQTTNRPVEALHDLQKAIELNDNRAVYRSRLLLDQDLAARSASLARIYTDLGFQQRALVEGWKSVNTDPSDFSGHRFLADTYAALPRHEIARVSELLLSQLLQPINITPIQPRLAESNLFALSEAGPSSLSFNEFNPLFNRNRIALQASGIVGSDDTYGEDVVASGIHNKLSFSIGQNHFQTDGVRVNNDLRDNIYNAFMQYSLSPRTSIQAEYRYRDNKRGDLELMFWADNIDPTLRFDEEWANFRVGFLHSFSPRSNLIGNFSYNKTDEWINQKFFIDPGVIDFPPPDIEDAYYFISDQKGYTGELQHIYRSDYMKIVSGAGYFKIDSDITLNENVTWPGEIPPLVLATGTDLVDSTIHHYNVYLYSYINPIKILTLTVGASGDFYKNDDENLDDRDQEKNQFNPKFGVTWNLLPDTTLRAAVFRTLKRTLVTEQTLEPTQVAGFNQFYDDINATEAWTYGIAVDQKFSQSLFGGAEYSYRDLEVPQLVPTVSGYQYEQDNWNEYMGRLYLYWTPHKWVGLRAGYGYEKFDSEGPKEGIRNSKTHSVPLGVNFYHPSGLGAVLKTTYYDQKGEFQRKDDFTFENGDSTFWVVDAAVSYRLPKRYGFVSVGATNLFDREFNYADLDSVNPSIQPGRTVYGKVTLALP